MFRSSPPRLRFTFVLFVVVCLSGCRATGLAWRPDSTGFVYTDKEGKRVVGFDLKTKRSSVLVADTDTHTMWPGLRPDGKRFASCNPADQTLRLWDLGTGKELKRIKVPNAYGVCFSPDGQRIASGSYPDGPVRVWDAASGKELRKYEGHAGAVIDVAFFPDGHRIVYGSYDKTVRIWRTPR